jgi:hypothetical protein
VDALPVLPLPATPFGGSELWPETHQPPPPSALVRPAPAPPRQQYVNGTVSQPRRDTGIMRRPDNNGTRTLLLDSPDREAPAQEPRALYASPLVNPALSGNWLDPCTCPEA